MGLMKLDVIANSYTDEKENDTHISQQNWSSNGGWLPVNYT